MHGYEIREKIAKQNIPEQFSLRCVEQNENKALVAGRTSRRKQHQKFRCRKELTNKERN